MLDSQTRKVLRLEDLRVLLVEDNKDMRMLVKSLLYAMGIRDIAECSDGGAALQDLKIRERDLIITEWTMEPIDGIELVKLLRTAPDSPCPRINIIMLTANTEFEQVIEARDAGITEFLAKPISAASLYTRVISVLKYRRPFVRAKGYVGPDRRRKFPGGFLGPERRVEQMLGD